MSCLTLEGRVLQPPGLLDTKVSTHFGGAGRVRASVTPSVAQRQRVQYRWAFVAFVAEAPVVPEAQDAAFRASPAAGASAVALSKAEPKNLRTNSLPKPF